MYRTFNILEYTSRIFKDVVQIVEERDYMSTYYQLKFDTEGTFISRVPLLPSEHSKLKRLLEVKDKLGLGKLRTMVI
jgi:hypothetical protein